MVGEEGPGMLYNRHWQNTLVVIISLKKNGASERNSIDATEVPQVNKVWEVHGNGLTMQVLELLN